MAKLWQTLFRRREIERYNVTEYLDQINNPYAILESWTASTNRFGQPAETSTGSFDHFVNRAYKSNGIVFAIIAARMLLFTEARFQWRQVRFGDTGDLFGTDELRVLERPWPNGTTGELLARMEQDVSLAGNFYAVNEGDRLRRLRPDWVEIILTAPPEVAVQSDVLGYVYTPGGYGSQSEPVAYLPHEVCHWSPVPDPVAQYRGMSWLQPIIQEIEGDRSATEHKNAFFRNGAKPGLVVAFKESVTADQFKAFMAALNESHQGTQNAYKTLYLGGGADVTVAGADLRQLDFKNTQGAGETRICAAGRVPPIIVGASEGLQAATYSNYGQARRAFGDHWARPQWRSACAALESILDVPERAQLWYDDRDIAFLRDDHKDAAETAFREGQTIRTLLDAGFTADSVKAAVKSSDWSLLEHSGLYSVQLQPAGTSPRPSTDPGGEAP